MAEIFQRLESEQFGESIRVSARPDITRSTAPRWDLQDISSYHSMPVQFNRGCPIQCEFYDVTYMFGRKVRSKTPARSSGSSPRSTTLAGEAKLLLWTIISSAGPLSGC